MLMRYLIMRHSPINDVLVKLRYGPTTLGLLGMGVMFFALVFLASIVAYAKSWPAIKLQIILIWLAVITIVNSM